MFSLAWLRAEAGVGFAGRGSGPPGASAASGSAAIPSLQAALPGSAARPCSYTLSASPAWPLPTSAAPLRA